ncbi:type I-B CRISPR-associated endonuclease Cas1b [Desulfoscipio gibsoniae]|uniref:CRISPR-associated endonuclease Cas1 n=1 Tax=Desulfoscipio gibsoniae DSM 7213 TaxID=767817 RepID=R4KAA9_9FIRM|nr:type I-B CRISPR-associated endonuclease Cas1b [Desulfoscipio gibsoniae]AGL00113.1 CRISPR-associated endonuclease Cas1 [Desulfoscipio gibsoniae DSM 7213]
MGKSSDTRYIFSTGDLYQKDFSIVFRKEDGNFYLPIKDTRELYCFNEITLSTKLLQLLAKVGIVVHFFGYYENYIGTFYPKEQLLSGRLTVAQALAYEQNRLKIAGPIVKGIAKNIHFVLYHYYRHGKSELKDYLDWLRKDVSRLADAVGDIKQLLRIEGEIWARFYQTFRLILPESFAMNKRVKRPPDNPINALISFGNTLLYTKTITEIYHTHLNQTISFLHEPAERRFSLSLDLSEVFKPVLVYKTIFDCVNNRKITVEKHFDKKLNYALLNEIGRKTFIEAFEERLNQTFEHQTLKRRCSYKQAIRLDGYKLIKHILEGKNFVPFCMEDKK